MKTLTTTPKRAAQPARRKHIPQRTCVGCRQVQGKRAMVRVVRTPDNGVVVDPTGKRAGRGAYICASRACWQAALKGRLEHALKTTLTPADRERLTAFMETLPEVAPLAEATATEGRA